MTDIITLEDAKSYLKIDYNDEDDVIKVFMKSAQTICREVGRLSAEDWEQITSPTDSRVINGVEYSVDELGEIKNLLKSVSLFGVAFLMENRENADLSRLTLTLRAMLFSLREGAPM